MESFDICKTLAAKLEDEYRTVTAKFETLRAALQKSEEVRAEKESEIIHLSSIIKKLHEQHQEDLRVLAQKAEDEVQLVKVIKQLKERNDKLQSHAENVEIKAQKVGIKQKNALSVAQSEIDHLRRALAEVVSKVNQEAFEAIDTDSNYGYNFPESLL